MQEHTCTRTPTRARPHAHTHMHTQTQMHTHTHAHARPRACTRIMLTCAALLVPEKNCSIQVCRGPLECKDAYDCTPQWPKPCSSSYRHPKIHLTRAVLLNSPFQSRNNILWCLQACGSTQGSSIQTCTSRFVVLSFKSRECSVDVNPCLVLSQHRMPANGDAMELNCVLIVRVLLGHACQLKMCIS